MEISAQVPSEKNVFMLAEHSQGQLEDISLETLACARQLAGDLGGRVHAVVVGPENQAIAGTLAGHGADRVLFLSSPLLQDYSPELYLEALCQLLQDEKPGVFLCGATVMARDLAPRLAARLETGLISECSSLSVNKDGTLQGTRLTHGGRVGSTLACSDSRPQMATLKPGSMTAAKPDTTRKPEVTVIEPALSQDKLHINILGVVRADPDKISLDEADVVIAGGKGMGSRENFQELAEIARTVGGVVAGSLGAVDEGWLPRKKLVGQTGTTVAPRLYLACGISGSVYHVLGMRDSEFVIAINKDRNAPIFKVADMSIIGDNAEIVPAIIQRLHEATGNLSL